MQLPGIRIRRPRPTYASVASTLALVLAMSMGGAYAHGMIGSAQLKQNAVKSRHIGFQQVTTPDLAKRAVSTNRIKPQAVTRSRLAPNARATVIRFTYGPHNFGATEKLKLRLPGVTKGALGNSQWDIQTVRKSGSVFDVFPLAMVNNVEAFVYLSWENDAAVVTIDSGGVYWMDETVAIRVFQTLHTSSKNAQTAARPANGRPSTPP